MYSLKRFKFNSIQKERQGFDNFLTELCKAAKTTSNKDQDNMVRDRIVIGILDKRLQKSLLRESGLTLEKAINMCTLQNASKSQARMFKNENQVSALKVDCLSTFQK